MTLFFGADVTDLSFAVHVNLTSQIFKEICQLVWKKGLRI